MSERGYKGKTLAILLNGQRIAAVRAKSVAHTRTPIDRSDEENTGWRYLDRKVDTRSISISCEGVATINNYPLIQEWLGNSFSDVSIQHADGTIDEPTGGAFLQSLTYSGEHDGYVAFEASFIFSADPGSTPTPPDPNPTPTLVSIDPSSAFLNGDAFVMTLTGTGFIPTSVARFGGSARATTYISSTVLQAQILPTDLDELGSFDVTVFNPAPGGGESNALPFQVVVVSEAFFAGPEYTSPSPLVANSTHPAGVYDASTDKTWIAWEGVQAAGTSYRRCAVVSVYDHTTESWGDSNFMVDRAGLQNDDHGMPALVIDHEGHVHVFSGSHNSAQRHASTSAPRDPSTFVVRNSLAGAYSYPKPHRVGSGLVLLLRDGQAPYRLTALHTTALSNGVATWGSPVTLADPEGSSDRFYAGPTWKDGDDKIHIIAAIADMNDTYRRDVYYLIYNPSDGSVSNWDESVTVTSANLPVKRTQLDADYRIIDQGSAHGVIPSFCFDSNGTPHVVYAESSDGMGAFQLYHIYVDSGAWTSPEEVGEIPDRRNNMALVPMDDGQVALYHVVASTHGFAVGGDIVRRIWDGEGWGDQQVVLEADDHGLQPLTAVVNAHEDLRVVMSEVAEDREDDSLSSDHRIWAHGDGGFVRRTAYMPLFHMVELLVSFDGTDGATSATDDSHRSRTVTLGGGAELTDDESLFGSTTVAAVLGSGQYIETENINLGAQSFCIEGWVKFRNFPSSGTACRIFAQWGTTGNNSYRLSIDSGLGTQRIRFFISTNGQGTGDQTVVDADPSVLSDGEWHHIAVERVHSTVRLYIDGEIADENTSFTDSIFDISAALRLGSAVSSPGVFDGYFAEWRFTRGWWRYNGAFTPPAGPFPRPSNP